MELISVLIPTYNVENYVEEAIVSILAQSYSNLEIIIVDDASTDNTFEILKKLRKGDSRIKLFSNDSNRRIAETLNKAFSISQGELILRMDGDDISVPERLERLYCFLKENPEIDLVGSNTITIDESGSELGKSKFPIEEDLVYSGLNYKMSPVAHIWLAKRMVYEKLNGYRFPPVEDYDFLLRARTSGFRFTNVDEYLYKVRIRKGNTASTQGLFQRLAADTVHRLYRERLQDGREKNSNFDKLKNSVFYSLQDYFHSQSNKYISKALSVKGSFILFSLYTATGILLSPFHQTKFLYYRFKSKRLSRCTAHYN